jgi:hypothetical protein
LKEADKRGIEISLVYRENKLTNVERQKLTGLVNLNLLCHPEIHAKCYFNEADMIITSMNLYEYSEKYNREMGILLTNSLLEDSREYNAALSEVRDIVKTATLEKKSARTADEGFTSSLLKPKYERLTGCCKLVNRFFDNKKFEVVDDGDNGTIKCLDYFENIHVFIEPDTNQEIDVETGKFRIHRISIDFGWDDEKRKAMNGSFMSRGIESMFEGYKVYWDHFSKKLTIYRDQRQFPEWDSYTLEESVIRFKEGIESVSSYIRQLEKQFR